MMKESDWKKFKTVKALALDRFCANALAAFEEALHNSDMTNHQRYLHLYRLVDETDERLGSIFNGHSRSRALLQLLQMRNEGLVEDHELEGISDEFLESTRPR